jgi:hypothetical protein
MKRQICPLVLVTVLTLMGLLLGGTLLAAAAPGEPGATIAGPDTTAPAYTYNTVITVTSGTDPNDSKSETCYTGTSSDRSPCTLRRAIVESRGLSAGELPVLIRFNIPEDAGEGYDNSLDIWEIQVYNTTDLYAFRRLKGQVIIDGDTQPGGRAEGPKIFVIGPGTGQKTGFVVGDIAGDDEIIIRGLGFQNFKTHMYVNTDDNLIEECWFGLSTDGTTLTSGDISEPEGGSAIAMTTGSDRNGIRNNRFAGFYGAAVAIRGNTHEFTGNRIGMRADGSVPIPAQFDKHPCSGSSTWAGGSGITIEGDDHHIGGPDAADGNRFSGLYLDVFGLSEQPFAIQFTGATENVLVQNNVIGLDGNDDTIGICGRGLKLSNGPLGTQVISNTFVETGLSALLMNHWTLNGNTLRGNVIRRESAWPGEQGDNTFPEGAIAYGAEVPLALKAFRPAVITEIDGTDVTGVSGSSQNGQACAYCTVELFLDDTDTVTEALQSLVVVTADGSGNWSATLPAPLADGQGVRTMSTVPDEWTIDDLDAGTTSGLSVLYANDFRIYLPLVVR